MRLVTTETITAGVVLAKTIRNANGQVLLSKGVTLSDKIIKRLIDTGIRYVYIEDGLTDDVVLKEAVSEELRAEAVNTIEDTFKQVQKDLKNNQSLVIEKASKKLINLVRKLLSEIKNDEDLLTLLSDIYIYDEYVFTHSLNVTLYSLAIAQRLKLSPHEIETLGLGALLHDVGKMKIEMEILNKPGKLTKDEFEKMKLHTNYGFQILKDVGTVPLLVAHCAFQHHERLNGSGYPRGIKDNDIHLFAKIIAVADVFDAVTSNRIYRSAMMPHEGLEILYAGAGPLFVTEIVDAFRKTVAIYPVGMSVQLNDGCVGVVIKQNIGFSDRPIIRVFERDGERVEPYEIDLTKKLDVVVTDCDLSFSN